MAQDSIRLRRELNKFNQKAIPVCFHPLTVL